nr:pentapeptide repeat-containing protein [Roseomonas sp. GC11]
MLGTPLQEADRQAQDGAFSLRRGGPVVGRVRSPFYIPGVRTPILPLLALALLIAGAAPTLAACADPPAPRVDWRRCMLDGRDLSGARLDAAVLRDASFARARLDGARLPAVEAPDSRFTSASAQGVDFSGAILRGADFTRTALQGARFIRADLRGARFYRADLSGADMTGARLDGTDLSTATLDGALWVDGQTRCAAGSVGACQ